MEDNQRRFYEIDTLKGIMTFCIVLFHLSGTDLKEAFPNILHIFYRHGGDYGNTLFFMLSGFMMYYVYLKKVHNIALSKFLYNRVSKIYLTYFLSSFVVVLFQIKNSGIQILTYKSVVLNIFLITTGWVEDIYPFNIPCWFLISLMLQYMIWYIVTKKNKDNCHYIYVGLIFLGLAMEKLSINKPFFYYHTGEAMVPFFEGCLLCKLWKDKNLYCNKLIKIGWGVLMLFLVLARIMGFDNAAGERKYVWYFLIVPLVILTVLEVRAVKNFLRSKIMYFLFGTISTYVFFWHVPCINIYYMIINGLNIQLTPNMRFVCYIFFLYLFCTVYKYLLCHLQIKEAIHAKRISK